VCCGIKTDPVPDEMLKQVLQAAISAPSAANTQPWSFVTVTQPDLVEKVGEYLIYAQKKFVFGKIIGLSEAFTDHLSRLYADFLNVPCFIILCRNQRVKLVPDEYQDVLRDWDLCSLGGAMANLMTAATALGLGTRWFGGPLPDNRGQTLKDMFSIPDHVEIVGVTPLGFHDEPLKDRPVQPLSTLTGFKRKDKYSLAALLKGKVALEDVVHMNQF
jgi:nitroreductase